MSADLNLSAQDIIKGALRDAGIIPIEQRVESVDYETGLERLNYIFKMLQAQGLHLWTKTQGIIPLNKGQRLYKLGPNGDFVANQDDFFFQTLTAAAVVSDTQIQLNDTSNIAGAPDILVVDPTESTANWDAGSSAVLSVSSGNLTIENGAATQGFADLDLETSYNETYILTVNYTAGTSATLDVIVQDIDGIISTTVLTGSQTVDIEFTARQLSTTLTLQNGSAVLGEDSIISSVNYIDKSAGDKIGVLLDDGTRQWTNVVTVDSAALVTVNDALTAAAALSNTVYTFTDLIPRPMRLLQAQFGERYTFTEIPTTQWNRSDYFDQPNKDSSGTLVNWYYSHKITDVDLYVWQVASNANQVLRFTYIRPINITMALIASPDVPAEWFTPLKWLLASELGPQYGVTTERQMVLDNKSQGTLALATDHDVERGDMAVQPSMGGMM
jgi:hypothetical protein